MNAMRRLNICRQRCRLSKIPAMKIEIDRPLDMHLHLRDGEMLKLAAPHSAADFAGAVVMPNLVPPVNSAETMASYRSRIADAAGTFAKDFSPLMTVFLQKQSYEELENLKTVPGFFAMKLYPAGATTNSDGGVRDFGEAEETLRAMEDLGIPLLVHGESNGFVMDRETEFLPVYRNLAIRFPKLKICMEHISTAAALPLLGEFENLFATVTLHHLLYTLDDLAGGLLNPHFFCKPIVKRPEDRAALRGAVFGGNAKIMFGSDSAPHPVSKKECAGAFGGIYSAPVLLPALAELFEKNNALGTLNDFLGGNARRIYGLPKATKKIVLEKKTQRVPEIYCGADTETRVVPMLAGKEIAWSVSER